MEWFTAITGLIEALAWPVTVLVALLAFRREIRQRLQSVTQVKFPGGSVTLAEEVERLEERLEASPAQEPLLLEVDATVTSHAGTALGIAGVRLDAEQELAHLRQAVLPAPDGAQVPWQRQITELSRAGAIEKSMAQDLRDFFTVANAALHDPDLSPDLSNRAMAVGVSLVAVLKKERLVREAVNDFERHGIWHMWRKGRREAVSENHYFMSAVAAQLPLFNYDYEVYVEAAGRHNTNIVVHHPDDTMYVLSPEEFAAALEHREREVLRLTGVAPRDFGQENDWKWPSEWGDVGWGGPVLRERPHVRGAHEELIRLRPAISHHRARMARRPSAS